MARKNRRNSGPVADIPIPDEAAITAISKEIMVSIKGETVQYHYAPVKHVLSLIGAGIQPGAVTTVSKSKPMMGGLLKGQEQEEWDPWRGYNPSYLGRTLKRLKKQGFVASEKIEKKEVFHLADRGKRWILKYAVEALQIPKSKTWDGKWRMVIYDVAGGKASLRNIFRDGIKKLGFYKLQDSIWMYPYPCEKEVSLLRQYCGMADEVIYLIAHKIERDTAYRKHFGL